MTVRDTVRGDQVVWEHAVQPSKRSRDHIRRKWGGKGSAVAVGWMERAVSPARDGPRRWLEGQPEEGAPVGNISNRKPRAGTVTEVRAVTSITFGQLSSKHVPCPPTLPLRLFVNSSNPSNQIQKALFFTIVLPPAY